ncbi:hypothetical protein [Variovorax guangxiensis]|uniref:Uncharacterized protein n=1 Tax=Variovorax guangxiensis TaxID=1775474 RepID=A0A840FXZ4_9BURK|nr:hypothetical protein [Variovorax guangxiensis]MBB4225134.1 hypothetical protein [Variovorax guangxiensis]
MSHPVYLSSSKLPRMPEGSRNEWRGFFGRGGELEANAFFPLFWRALFSEGDIRHARFVEAYDIDDEDSAIEREECLQDYGPEAAYPYLVTDKATALSRLAARREAIVAAIGERYRPLYEGFEAWTAQGFADHILLRTEGLPDAADAEPWLRSELALVDKLNDTGALAGLVSDLSRHDTDPVWQLAGIGASPDGPWPTPAVRAIFPDPRQRAPRKQGNARQAEERKSKPRSWIDPVLEWLAVALSSGAALGTYAFTRSIWLTLLVFLCAAIALGLGVARLRGPRS